MIIQHESKTPKKGQYQADHITGLHKSHKIIKYMGETEAEFNKIAKRFDRSKSQKEERRAKRELKNINKSLTFC